MHVLDYLASRADVDGLRIGAAGCSGRGALTTFTGGLDPLDTRPRVNSGMYKPCLMLWSVVSD